ncbi:hypothetical protein GCM10023205_79660 [Yinghuangia aomiensis]|uniref:Uncharacterized protein n=1 Tax=Yinghuangia aomiensis TaxID=676205 RepID=A0ABP9ICM8_9ACTN
MAADTPGTGAADNWTADNGAADTACSGTAADPGTADTGSAVPNGTAERAPDGVTTDPGTDWVTGAAATPADGTATGTGRAAGPALSGTTEPALRDPDFTDGFPGTALRRPAEPALRAADGAAADSGWVAGEALPGAAERALRALNSTDRPPDTGAAPAAAAPDPGSAGTAGEAFSGAAERAFPERDFTDGSAGTAGAVSSPEDAAGDGVSSEPSEASENNTPGTGTPPDGAAGPDGAGDTGADPGADTEAERAFPALDPDDDFDRFDGSDATTRNAPFTPRGPHQQPKNVPAMESLTHAVHNMRRHARKCHGDSQGGAAGAHRPGTASR